MGARPETLGGLAGLVVGPAMDRYGGRWLVVGGAVIAGLALMSLSVVHDLWQFLGLRGFLFAIGGVGMGPLVINVVLAKWFVRQRGRAISSTWRTRSRTPPRSWRS